MSQYIAETRQGRVKGSLSKGARQWLGIPYAVAPRFGAPLPPPAWDGVREATEMAPQCPQSISRVLKANEPGFDEDCLALNIWAPDDASDEPLPVFFWIHGGAFIVGSADPYRGEELAKQGRMIVVAINYRLGVLGFVNFGKALGIPELASNLGLRDQIAALEWVRDNIGAFGGDPARVTIAGESAGSMSVSLLMHAPASRGLFHGAILQSGAVSLIDSQEESLRRARRYAEMLGVDQGSLDKLRALDVATLLKAQKQVGEEYAVGVPASPWFDDDLLPGSFEETLVEPAHAVPVIAGHTRDESRLFEILPGDMLPTKRDKLNSIIRSQLPADEAERLLALYPENRKGRTALGTDLAFAMPTRQFAHDHSVSNPTWFYRFDAANPLFGAFHGMDLTYLFELTGFRLALVRGGGLTGKRRALATRMREHWAHFVHHGRPVEGWPAYTPEKRNVYLFDRKGGGDTVAVDPDGDRFRAWQGKAVTAHEVMH